MRIRHLVYWMITTTILLAICGCKKKGGEPVPQAAGPGTAEIAAVRNALTRGMQAVGADKLTKAHVGKRCVLTARSAPIPPPPPPLGMARIMGSITVYTGELNDVLPEAVKIRAAYPSSGNYKYIEIARTDIESIYLGG